MYLPLFNEEQKKLFLELAFHMVMADGVFSDEERNVMDCYYSEMKCKPLDDKSIRELNPVFNDIKAKFGEKEKKILVFEMLGLALADGDYAKEEKKIMEDLLKHLDISPDFEDKCKAVLGEYFNLQNKINKLVL